MDPITIRRSVLVALYSDPELQKRLVLKGGNAIELIHGIVARGSIDLDFAISGDFEDLAEIEGRLRDALVAHFRVHEIVVFDYKFDVVPPPFAQDPTPWWGGYRVTFKLMEQDRATVLDQDIAAKQREAIPIDSRQGRTFRVDISKHEYCDQPTQKLVGGVRVYAYTEEMLALEKLRAICQQMPEYKPTPGRLTPARRARDFFDIHSVVTARALDLMLPENLTLCRRIFAAKEVPLDLLSRVAESKEFHRVDWESVVAAVPGRPRPFEFYFDYTVELAGAIARALGTAKS